MLKMPVSQQGQAMVATASLTSGIRLWANARCHNTLSDQVRIVTKVNVLTGLPGAFSAHQTQGIFHW